jgi:tetratricopeptide (TPR) repeat protein
MSRGFVPGLYAWALMLTLCPVLVFAQSSGSAQTQPTPSAAEDNEARELFKIGKEAFDDGRFERALKYFNDAHELSHRPALLSNIGTALDRLRRDQEAVDAYRMYLEQVPEAANRPLVEDRIRIIQAALARSQAAPQPSAVAPPPTTATGSQLTPAETEGSARAEAPVPSALSPQQAALAAPSSEAPSAARSPLRDSGTTAVTSRWWFWTGIGAVAVAAVIVVVAVSAGGSSARGNPRSPTLLDPTTRVREL